MKYANKFRKFARTAHETRAVGVPNGFQRRWGGDSGGDGGGGGE